MRTAPEQNQITVEAFDEQNARTIAKEESRRQLGDASIVQSITMATAGKTGFLGISKKPNQYKVSLIRQALVEVSYKQKAKISINISFSYTKGLRPLGNKKRLTHTTDEVNFGYDVRLLLFRDKESAEKYYDLFDSYAANNPPPYLIEVMLFFIPRNIFAEKYAVVIPNENSDIRTGYKEWAKNAIWACNDTLKVHRPTDHKYGEIYRYIDVIYKWDILVPKNFSETSSAAKELLRDDPNNGFPSPKLFGQEEVTPKVISLEYYYVFVEYKQYSSSRSWAEQMSRGSLTKEELFRIFVTPYTEKTQIDPYTYHDKIIKFPDIVEMRIFKVPNDPNTISNLNLDLKKSNYTELKNRLKTGEIAGAKEVTEDFLKALANLQ